MEKILSQQATPYDIAQDIIKAVEQKRLKIKIMQPSLF